MPSHDRRDDVHGPDLVGRGVEDISAQDRDVAERSRRQVPAPALVAQGVSGIQSHGAQPLLGSQQLVGAAAAASSGSCEPARRSRQQIWSTGRPMSSVSSRSGNVHGASVAEARCSPASTKSRQRVSQPTPSAGSRGRTRPGRLVQDRSAAPSRWITVGDVHRRPGGPAALRSPGGRARAGDRADSARCARAPLVGVEDQLHARRSSWRGPIPASRPRPPRAIVSVMSSGSQFTVVPPPSSRWILNPWTRRRSLTGPGSRDVYQSPKNSRSKLRARYASTRSGRASSAASASSSSTRS